MTGIMFILLLMPDTWTWGQVGRPVEPDMVFISGGCFQMGSPESEPGHDANERRHRVCVKDFAIGRFEVTFEEYDRFAGETGRKKPDDVDWGRGSQPVISVSWFDAVAYARWLSQRTGRHYRLPTEAEWEYAARAGTESARYWGESPDQACRYANVADRTLKKLSVGWGYHDCDDGHSVPAPIGSFMPNPWGLHDVLGNVWEWTCSQYNKDYDGSERICNGDPGDGTERVLRGGSWFDDPWKARLAYRFMGEPADSSPNLGFRLALDP